MKFFLLLTITFLAFTVICKAQSTNTFPTTGNVGIGTTTPGQKLVVIGNTEVAGQVRADLGSTGNSLILTGTGSNFQVGHDGTANVQVFNSSGGAIQFNNNLNASTIFHIGGNGNVGIGTTSPSYNLDVIGAVHSLVSGGSNLVLSKNTGSSIEFNNGSGRQNALIEADNSTNRLEFWTNTATNTGLVERMRITSAGNVGIGTTSPDQALTVNGTVHSKSVVVDANIFPDYVFKPTYKLPTLTEVKTYIDQNHHLPNVPSATEVEKNGLNLGEMNKVLVQKVEELTLYLINKDNEDKEKDARLNLQQEQINQLKQQLNTLTKSISKN